MSVDQRPSTATAAGNARSAARVADNLSEPSDCPAGRRLAAALLLEGVVLKVFGISINAGK